MRNLHSVPRAEPLWDFYNPASRPSHFYDGPALGIDPTTVRRAIEGRFLRFPDRQPVYWDPAVTPDVTIAPRFTTYEATERAYRIMRDLTRTVDTLRQTMVDRSPYVALTIPADDWDVLRREMSPYMIERNFGHEGTVPQFMGLPIAITKNRLRY